MMTEKETVYNWCVKHVSSKIEELKTEKASLMDAKNNETKSTSGDKHEVGRAMVQIEEDRITKQMSQWTSSLNVLNKFNPKIENKSVVLGSLVNSSIGAFFIAIGVGKVVIENKTYFIISQDAPIAKALFKKEIGNEILFNGNKIKIQAIE